MAHNNNNNNLRLTIITLTAAILLTLLPTSTPYDNDEYYILDNPTPTRSRPSMSLFLKDKIRKGMKCNHDNTNICNGVSANNGTAMLYCCKNNCRNVIQDVNNCGSCGNKCGFGLRCCKGACISVAYDPNHCGECNQQCSPGQKCEYGSCGYA
ncbi:Protein GRIM REAPER [Linum perenne]